MLFLKQAPHVFKLKDREGKIVPFQLNVVQKGIIKEIEDQIAKEGRARLIIIKGRQQGVTTFMQLLSLSYVLTTPGYNAYTSCHDAGIANEIFQQKVKFAYDNIDTAIQQIFQIKRDNTRQLMFEGDLKSSNITVGLSARSTTQNLLHISEAGKMSMNNNLWQEMIEGSLPAAEKAEVIVIESTADGGKGKFYDFVQNSLQGKNEFKTLFLFWGQTNEYREKAPDNDEWIDDYKRLALRHTLSANPMADYGIDKDQFYWYYRKLVTLQGGIKAQYPCSLEEAFEMNVEGSYYQDLIDQMNAEQRFSDNPEYAHDKHRLVDTYWDLGDSSDLNVVLFVQERESWINIIDCYWITNVSVNEVAGAMLSRPYLYGNHYAPFDANQRRQQETGVRTKKEMYAKYGINFNIIPRPSSKEDGILTVKELFPRIRIHRNENTIKFVNMLRAYRKEQIANSDLYKEKHDEASHFADALRYLAIWIKFGRQEFNVTKEANPNVYLQGKKLTTFNI